MEVDVPAASSSAADAGLAHVPGIADPHLRGMAMAKDGTWAEVVLHYPLDARKLIMVSLTETVAAKTVLREVRGITRCFIEENEKPDDTRIVLATEGVNLRGMWEFADEIDVHRLSSNDVRAILNTYGVEAARSVIVREIGRVFGVYGISVDPRHLFLVADAMVWPTLVCQPPGNIVINCFGSVRHSNCARHKTFEGGYKPFNRIGMESSTAPFQKMSFETTTSFLRSATLYDRARTDPTAVLTSFDR